MTADVSQEIELVLKSVVGETADVLVLEFARSDNGELPAWAPGAHVDIALPSGRIRQYSLCGDVADKSTYRVAVLREAAGRGGSEEIHAIAKPGMALRLRGPRNHFSLIDAPRYLFLAGGIGITPLLPMIRHAERAGRPWELVYGGRSRASMAFAGEIASRGGGKVTLLPQDESGMPDFDAILARCSAEVAIYGCGPAGMLKALKAVAAQQGRSQALHIESFAALEEANSPASARENTPFEVELRKSGMVLPVPADRSLADVLQDAGIDVSYSCQEGYCGTCETRVLDGVPDHRDTILTEEEKAANNLMMVCCGRSRTPRLVLDL